LDHPAARDQCAPCAESALKQLRLTAAAVVLDEEQLEREVTLLEPLKRGQDPLLRPARRLSRAKVLRLEHVSRFATQQLSKPFHRWLGHPRPSRAPARRADHTGARPSFGAVHVGVGFAVGVVRGGTSVGSEG
jgi:hypothetical protein